MSNFLACADEPPTNGRRQWTHSEIIGLLSYMKDTISKGQELESNSPAYYCEVNEVLNYPNCNTLCIIRKVREMREAYIEARHWILEDAEIADVVKLFPYYDAMNDVYGPEFEFDCPLGSKGGSVSSAGSSVDDPADADEAFDPSCNSLVSNADNGADDASVLHSPKPRRSRFPDVFLSAIRKRQEILMVKMDIHNKRLKLEEKRLDLVEAAQKRQTELMKRQEMLEEKKQELEKETKKDRLQFEMEKIALTLQHEMEKFKVDQELKFKYEIEKLKEQQVS